MKILGVLKPLKNAVECKDDDRRNYDSFALLELELFSSCALLTPVYAGGVEIDVLF